MASGTWSGAKSTAWQGQGNLTSITDAFPQLTNLTLDPGTGRNPRMGGQNYTHCCLLAVNASLDIADGFIVQTPSSFIQTTVEDLLAATEGNQFPCTAKYDGNHNGAPVVQVPYSWLSTTCPGWQLSRSKPESQWISPFVGFLLPAVVFCLMIPRRRKLAVWNKLFLQDLSQVMSWLIAPFAMLLAGICVTIDTIMWLSICFAFGSPMLLSGFYEAYLDYIIIGFIQEKLQNNQLTIDMKARLLFVILCGNLDLDPEIRTLDEEMMHLPVSSDDARNSRWPDMTGNPSEQPRNPNSPWTHVENLVHDIRSYSDVANNVGLPVGAPVVFFLGTFVFTIVTTLSNLGDNDTSLALAFGMWFMIIPHVSIVSGLLLAGNNPNTLEGVVAHEFGDTDPPSTEKKHFGTRVFELAYDSRYRPQWLWFRGRSKRQWVEKVWKTYEYRHPFGQKGPMILDEDMSALRRATTLTAKSWGVILGMTFLLLAFYTPQVGISCRTLIFTVYTISQLCQILLWLWAYAGAPEEGTCPALMGKGGILHQSGFYTPTDVTSLCSWHTIFTIRSLWPIIWFSLAIIFGLGGVLTAIGGTVMQLMGVYRSNKCDINAEWWTRPHRDVTYVISSNSALAIYYANRYWLACGITATLFLAVVCFSGWWYQRRLRGLFRGLVSSLGDENKDREDIRAAVVRN
ncbi:uncharacterized protein RCO7_02209 [Rhynchosporium graminicola]|uniref:Uncharacterized protein n=1 Tax=Rhynchosporium graminicola TaxID=2792576 RepID=A0A1E1LHG4_9HELO|nr:uncharacterized protein RCO7_02209 [Rhynchosporium commune]